MSNSRVHWLSPTDRPDAFPPVDSALREPDGLLAAGGDLSSERILYAYQHGIFPWYEDGQPLLWWSPDPRCVFLPGDLRLSRRMQRRVASSSFEIRANHAFADVIRACAAPRRYQDGTWITNDMITAYERLHAEGWAHSIEVWDAEKLVGGLYGLAIGHAFFGESMWSGETDASKFALLYLEQAMQRGSLRLLDCQVISQHLLSLGARTLPRTEFMQIAASATTPAGQVGKWPGSPVPVRELLTA